MIRDQAYRGSRYSFGYPACPDLEDRAKLVELLARADRRRAVRGAPAAPRAVHRRHDRAPPGGEVLQRPLIIAAARPRRLAGHVLHANAPDQVAPAPGGALASWHGRACRRKCGLALRGRLLAPWSRRWPSNVARAQTAELVTPSGGTTNGPAADDERPHDLNPGCRAVGLRRDPGRHRAAVDRGGVRADRPAGRDLVGGARRPAGGQLAARLGLLHPQRHRASRPQPGLGRRAADRPRGRATPETARCRGGRARSSCSTRSRRPASPVRWSRPRTGSCSTPL